MLESYLKPSSQIMSKAQGSDFRIEKPGALYPATAFPVISSRSALAFLISSLNFSGPSLKINS